MKLTCSLLLWSATVVLPFGGRAAEILVAMSDARSDQTVEIPIGTTRAGAGAAAFTVVYDTAALDIGVESDFFGSFAAQYAASSAEAPRATEVTIDGRTYPKPLVVTPLPGRGLAVAGVSRQPAAGPVTLFTLRIALRAGAAPGLYPLRIEPTVVRLAAAGYPPDGTPTPLLVGRDRATDAYPVIVDAAGAATEVIPGHVRFSAGEPDSDQDGLPDSWEQRYFGNLTAGIAGGDFDGDGLTEIVESFLGSDPTRAESRFVIEARREGDLFVMRYPMRNGHGLTVAMEVSPDLRAWTSAGVTIRPRPELGAGPDWSMMEASVPAGAAPRLFLRLNLQKTVAAN